MNKKVRWITETAVMLALLVALQALTKGFGQFVTGSCVNAVLAVTVLTAGLGSGIVVAVLSPVLAYLLGIAPQILVLPAIMVGNTVTAVLAHSESSWTSSLSLNHGTDQDIAVGDCVVSAEGYLVGVISEVGLNWSTVLTVIDTDTELGARIFRTGEVAVAEGDFSLMGQGKLKLSYLTSDDEVLIGDQIVTSGLGGYYPSGLVIGSVESLQTGDDGLARYAVLAPMMDFDALTEVFVITDYDIVD